MERERASQETVQREKNLQLIDMTLQEIQRVNGNPARHAFIQNEHIKKLGETLWKTLPQDVTSLNLGQGRQISRDEDYIKRIPEDQRTAWDLPQVDQFAVTLARGIGKPYTPKFS